MSTNLYLCATPGTGKKELGSAEGTIAIKPGSISRDPFPVAEAWLLKIALVKDHTPEDVPSYEVLS